MKNMTSNCGICAEPIYHPICIDCLGKNVKKWLDSEAPYLISEFRELHEKVKENFWKDAEGWEMCTSCKSPSHLVLCTYCYVREVYHHLRQFNQNLADKLTRVFNFDFGNTGYHVDFEPGDAPMVKERENSGKDICEECENYSEFLEKRNGSMKCKQCEAFESRHAPQTINI